MAKKKNTNNHGSHRESHEQIVQRLASLEAERREKLAERVRKLEDWAIGFSARLEIWIKVGSIALITLMAIQTPVIKDVIAVILK